MKTKFVDMFPIPFSLYTLGERSRPMNKQLLKDIYENIPKEQENHRTGIGVFQSPSDMETKLESFTSLQEMVTEIIQPFLAKIGFRGNTREYIEVKSFWFNYNNTSHAYHLPHIHGSGNTILAGTYYPSSGIDNGVHLSDSQNLDEEALLVATSHPEPGSIVFMDPCYTTKKQIHTGHQLMNLHPYYGLQMALVPKEGTLVIFPNYLPHAVLPTGKENFERFSIAFAVNLIR